MLRRMIICNKELNQIMIPEIALWNIQRYGAVKTHIIACGVIKTTPNNLPKHVAYDTSTQVFDTSTVDLENSY